MVPLQEDSSVGRFRLIRRIALGGFSDVWEATDTDGTRVALKTSLRRGSASGTWMQGRHNARGYAEPTGGAPIAHTFSTEDVLRLFAAEIARLRAAAGKRMPHLIDNGLDDGVPYLVTELLHQFWDLPSATPRDFVDVLWALHDLTHANLSSHGDLKPEHVFRRADGSILFLDPGFYDGQHAMLTWTPAYNPWRTPGTAGDIVAVALMAWQRYAAGLPLASELAGSASAPSPPPLLGAVAPAPRGIAQWVDTVLGSAAETPVGLHHLGGRTPTWMHSYAGAAEHLTALSAAHPEVPRPVGLARWEANL